LDSFFFRNTKKLGGELTNPLSYSFLKAKLLEYSDVIKIKK